MVALAALVMAFAAQNTGWVWIEAESPANTNFPAAERNPFAPTNPLQTDQLSGGKWIGLDAPRTETKFLEYSFAAPSNGTYQVYARKFWKHGPYRWRIDNGPWTSIGGDVALMDEAPLRQFLVVNWTHAGQAELSSGPHTLRIELTSNEGAAAFDAFMVTKQPLVARGKLKPGEKYNRSDPGYFPFEPEPDTYRNSAIDLRSLNEKFAGENGFIGTKGESFIHRTNGRPIRFWAINTGHDTLKLDQATIRNMARAWAKSGVNLVRLHGAPWGEDFRKVNRKDVERTQFFVEALKKEGIYTCLSIYFPLWLRLDEKSGFAGYSGGKHPFALLFFNKEFQAIYHSWWRELLTAISPSTGKNLTQEPAVAMLEMVNEDSNLFWTFTPYENIPAPQMEILERQFGSYVATKYGSVAHAFTAWGTSSIRGDDAATGRAGFMPLWDVFTKRDRRSQDTARFLTETQRTFFVNTLRLLRSELGYKGTITGSNWITADARVLGPLDKWSNTVADFMDHHGYFDVGHTGERASYSISPGDRYEDRSALTFQPVKAGEGPNFSLPIFDIRYNGMPSTISEVNWTPPNELRADFPLVAAAYGALQGTDSVMFFATGAPWWEESLAKFGIRTPVTFGQFPATAFMYRKGLIKEGIQVAAARISLTDLFELKGAPLSSPAALDQLRQQDIPAGKALEVSRLDAIDPLAFLVGKVDMVFTPQAQKSSIVDLSKYIDHSRKVAVSSTGELTWDYGQGLVKINAPAAQGVTGFLSKAGTIDLGAMKLQSGLEYGSVLAVALDLKPLTSSSKILLQVMSREQPFGWKASGSIQKLIESVGSAPMTVQNLTGKITWKRKDAEALRVTALDFNGYPKTKLPSSTTLSLQASTLYYLIEK